MNFTRRDLLKRMAAAPVAAAVTLGRPGALGGEPPPARRPNVLLIITDQQHAGMLSCAGNLYLKTPNMDGLAQNGIRFERAYCGNPVCLPSRFNMLTGVPPSCNGIEHNGHGGPVPQSIMRHALGRLFRQAGYETAYGGKTHLPPAEGEPRKDLVLSYGFDRMISADQREGLADAAAEFLRAEHERPFLLVASFINPHDICFMAIDAHAQAAGKPQDFPASRRDRECLAEALKLPQGVSREEFFARLCPPLPPNHAIPEGEPEGVELSDWRAFRHYVRRNWTEEDWRMHRWAYARLTERVDAEIGRVLKALRESGRQENTLVVLVSDHGDLDSAHRLEHKSQLYEEAVRVPLIVSWKGVTPPGRADREHLASTGLDLIPTLCDFAGIAVPAELKGRSLRALAEGRGPGLPAAASAQAGAWRESLVVENEGSRLLLWGRFKYMVYAKGQRREQLVDLDRDPGEMKNLALDPAMRGHVLEGRRRLQQWYADHGYKLDPAYVVKNGGE
ncbi:MAG: sulfatase [Planctomycetes bacterium]|nr:sulfatase [Planctomycetota bacterium]